MLKPVVILLLFLVLFLVAIPTQAQSFSVEAGFSVRYQRVNEIAVVMYERFVSAENDNPSDALGGQVDVRCSGQLQRFSLSAGIGAGKTGRPMSLSGA